MPTYEVLHAIRRKADEEPQSEGTVSMSEEEAQVFLDRGAVRPAPGGNSGDSSEDDGGTTANDQHIDATDGAREQARELGVDLSQVSGTGAEGRIQAYDVQRHAKEAGESDPQ